jgi:uncharacterized protein YqeY
MTIIEKLRADQIAARKNKDTVRTTLLSTLIGETVKVGKDKDNRESTDEEAIAVVKKFKKNLLDTIALLKGSNAALDDELALYDSYLPKQLSTEDLTQTITRFVAENTDAKMKDIMAYLKTNFAGLYDGKEASQISNQILTKPSAWETTS